MADYSLLGALTGPGANAGDPTQINLGLLFRVTSQCWLKALRFWRADTGIGGAPFGRLYAYTDEDNGVAVAGTDATFVLSGTGWQQADITPVELTVNQLYKVVINFPDGYCGTGGYFATGDGVGGIVSGPITAPDAGGAPLGMGGIKQGTFTASASLVYPTSYFNGGNYWVDVLVTDVDPGGAATIEPTGIATGEAFGTPVLSLSLAPSGIATGEAFGAAVVSPGAVTVAPGAIGPGEAFGAPTLGLQLAPPGIAAGEAFGTPAVSAGPVTIAPSGIASAEVFGLATVTGGTQLAWPPRAGEVGVEHLVTAGEVGVD